MSCRTLRFLFPVFTLAFGSAWAVAAEETDPAGMAFFEQKIRPVLVEHCYECHSAQAKKLKSNLFLDSRAGWQKGGDGGQPVIIPGDPENSLLIRTIRHLEEDLEMPPKKPKLPDAVIADFITWVKQGAPDPRTDTLGEARRADKSWWSLQRIARLAPNKGIDEFVAEKLKDKGLGLNPPADPAALIRRMSYDVIGLPPTYAEVQAFVAAAKKDAEAATRELVDRLLASPHYGERWGGIGWTSRGLARA